MDYERFSPCEHERFANLWVWLATDCWCCSGFRALLALGLPALWLGSILPDSWSSGLFIVAVTGALVVAFMASRDSDKEDRK